MNIRLAVASVAIVAAAVTQPGGCASTGTSTPTPGQPATHSIPAGSTGYCQDGNYTFGKTHAKRVAECKAHHSKIAEEQTS